MLTMRLGVCLLLLLLLTLFIRALAHCLVNPWDATKLAWYCLRLMETEALTLLFVYRVRRAS